MYAFGEFIGILVDFLRIPINIFGYDTSLWGVFLFSIFSSVCGYVIGRFFR